ncbi:MAG: hypothetical protein AAF368_12270, partial [Planctomycetota bacterium]
NDDALKSVRLVVNHLISAVEEGSAHSREQMASVGSAQRHDDAAGDAGGDPRPTQPIRPLPPLVKMDQGDGAAPAADAAPAAETPPAPAADAAPAAEKTEG